MLLRAGMRLAGRFEIVGSEVAGAGVRTYHALDHEAEVQVSVWAFEPALFADDESRRRFVTLCKRAGALSHGSLRRVHDAGIEAGVPWMALQRLDGEPLGELAARGVRLDPRELSRLVTAMAAALAVAHEAGLVHGRLTPDDVWLCGGVAKVGGVGPWAAVRAGGGGGAAAAWREAMPYVAPEVLAGEPPGPRADVWALALITAELALGTRAPMGATAAAMSERLRRDLPQLAGPLCAALAEEPSRRPASPTRLAELITATVLAAEPAIDDDAPTTHRLAAPPAEDDPEFASMDEPAPAPIPLTKRKDTSASQPLPLAAPPPTPHPMPGPRLPSAGPPAPSQFAPTVREPQRPMAPTIREPRAPTHREGSIVLPAAARAGRPPPRMPKWAIYTAGGALAAGLIALALALSSGGEDPQPAAAAPDAAATVDAAPAPVTIARPLEPCPQGMLLIADPPSFCIDSHESPGEGFTPATGVTVAQAREACKARGKRLCTAEEWEHACRGKGGASYPYGAKYAKGKCNVKGGAKAKLMRAGEKSGCVSAIGAVDMAGNAAEWVEEGQVRGGSAADGHDGRCSKVGKKPGAGFAADDVGYRCCAAPGAY